MHADITTAVFAVFAFLFVHPMIFGVESILNILPRVKLGYLMPTAPRWISIGWFAVVGPSIILVLGFGIIIVGNAAHFKTAHGVSLTWRRNFIVSC
jgi:hypothetical protein